MPQVEGDGMGAQEDPAGHLAVAQALGHQVGDGAFGVGQAGRSRRQECRRRRGLRSGLPSRSCPMRSSDSKKIESGHSGALTARPPLTRPWTRRPRPGCRTARIGGKSMLPGTVSQYVQGRVAFLMGWARLLILVVRRNLPESPRAAGLNLLPGWALTVQAGGQHCRRTSTDRTGSPASRRPGPDAAGRSTDR